MTPIQTLIAKVEAGESRTWEIQEAATEVWTEDVISDAWANIIDGTWKAYNGSLDAAISLLEAVLPGWEWGAVNNDEFYKAPAAFVARMDDPKIGKEATSETPARALLLCILKAMEDGE